MATKELKTDNGSTEGLTEEEMDVFKSVMASVLLDNTDMDRDLIFDIVFTDTGQITWH